MTLWLKIAWIKSVGGFCPIKTYNRQPLFLFSVEMYVNNILSRIMKNKLKLIWYRVRKYANKRKAFPLLIQFKKKIFIIWDFPLYFSLNSLKQEIIKFKSSPLIAPSKHLTLLPR